jgi:hypothetical protein
MRVIVFAIYKVYAAWPTTAMLWKIKLHHYRPAESGFVSFIMALNRVEREFRIRQ